MLRKDMLKALEAAGAALGRQELRPQLACLWFDGKTVMAYDDLVAIEVPCTLEVDGGLQGSKLISLVGKTPTERAVRAEMDGSNVTVRIGGLTKVRMQVMPAPERHFKLPPWDDSAVVKVPLSHLRVALEQCLKTAGEELEKPEFYGVTFLPTKGKLLVCSGDSAAMVKTTVAMKGTPKFTRVVLPKAFCTQAVRYMDEKGAELELHDTGALLRTPSIEVYGRGISKADKNAPVTAIHQSVEAAAKTAGKYMPVPTGLEDMLARGSVFEGEHNSMELAIIEDKKTGKKRLRMVSTSGDIELIDVSNSVAADVDPISVQTNAKYMHSCCKMTRMSIAPKFIIMRTDDDVDVDMVQAIAVGAGRA